MESSNLVVINNNSLKNDVLHSFAALFFCFFFQNVQKTSSKVSYNHFALSMMV